MAILIVPVRVTPRAGKDALTLENGVLRARLTAPPVDGAANDALLVLVAARLRVPRRSVTLLRGAASRDKLLAIEGIDEDEMRSRLQL